MRVLLLFAVSLPLAAQCSYVFQTSSTYATASGGYIQSYNNVPANGYSDTKAYRDMVLYLSDAEAKASFTGKHDLEVHAPKIAAGAAILVALLLGESARLWARKQAAKRKLSGR